jgi:DnaJ-class molecular chaperone
VLSDAHKRQVYNRFGKVGLAPDGGASAAAAGSYQDVFRNMFHQAQQQRQQQRNQTLRYQLQVTLEDLYHGKIQSVMVAPPQPSYQHYNQHNSSRKRQKKVDVHIPKGSINGQSITLSGEVDFHDDTTPGDLVFILTQAMHPTFTRKGHDLAMELEIGLEEALCGLQRPIVHLNGEELWIESAKTPQGRPLVIQTGDVQVLKGWDMPKPNHHGEYGDLYIQYRVEMPKAKVSNALTEDEMKELSRLLSKLQGSNKFLCHGKGGSKIRKKKEQSNMNVSADEREEDEEMEGELHGIHLLQDAKPSDFGTASGKVIWEEEDGLHGHQDHGDDFHPFAASASAFFGSGSSSQGSTGSSFYFGGNFGSGNPYGDDDDGNVQCQQM